jgi:GT2 family glycosyltransferase
VISIFLPIRNAAHTARECLNSLAYTFRQLRFQEHVEYILLDDASNPEAQIPNLMLGFRQAVPSEVKILRFPNHRHYTSACAYGFSVARGSQIILVSHDMVVTPDYVRTLLAVAASDPQIGIIRGTSRHMDSSVHGLSPSIPLTSHADILTFSAYVANTYGLTVADDLVLVGDSMLIQRPVLEKIGVMDQRFVGFLGDFDFGFRAQRAGFRVVTAKGAWLHHLGGGAVGADVSAGRVRPEKVIDGMSQLESAYKAFREKWPVPLPPTFAELKAEHLSAIQTCPLPPGADFVSPVSVDPAICQIL